MKPVVLALGRARDPPAAVRSVLAGRLLPVMDETVLRAGAEGPPWPRSQQAEAGGRFAAALVGGVVLGVITFTVATDTTLVP